MAVVLRSIDECSSEWFGNSCRNFFSDITVTAAPVSNSNSTGDPCKNMLTRIGGCGISPWRTNKGRAESLSSTSVSNHLVPPVCLLWEALFTSVGGGLADLHTGAICPCLPQWWQVAPLNLQVLASCHLPQ